MIVPGQWYWMRLTRLNRSPAKNPCHLSPPPIVRTCIANLVSNYSPLAPTLIRRRKIRNGNYTHCLRRWQLCTESLHITPQVCVLCQQRHRAIPQDLHLVTKVTDFNFERHAFILEAGDGMGSKLISGHGDLSPWCHFCAF